MLGVVGVLGMKYFMPPSYLSDQQIVKAAEYCMKKKMSVKFHFKDNFQVFGTECVNNIDE